MACDEDEIDEVRSLLTRHRQTIIKDLNESNLIQILVKNHVISVIDEEKLNSFGDTSESVNIFVDADDDDEDGVVDVDDDKKLSDRENKRKLSTTKKCSDLSLNFKCDYLIEFISKNGFLKFKEFCYAIETECPKLIAELIEDKLKYDPVKIGENEITDCSTNNNRDTIESKRSQRSTSYTGSVTPTQVSSSRRSSVGASSSSTPTPQHPPSTSTSSATPNSSNTTPNHNHQANLLHQHNNNYSTVTGKHKSNYDKLPTKFNTASPRMHEKKDKLLQRFSTPIAMVENLTLGRKKKKDKLFNRAFHSMNETIEVLADPVFEDDALGERTSWEYHTVTVTRVPGYGFGIAVSGGRDNPHFANGDPSIAVSDVLKGGPAEDRLQVNDRIISVNGVSLENVEYATAVQVLRDSGNTVTLVVKRRVPNLNMIGTPNHQHSHSLNSTLPLGGGGSTSPQQTVKLVLSKTNKKDDFGIVLGCRLFVKEISSKARDQLAASGYTLQEGDVVTRIHNTNCNDSMSLKEAKKIIDGCKEKLNLVVLRELPQPLNSPTASATALAATSTPNNYMHTAQVSNCSNVDEAYLPGGPSYSAQNLYVQPPTRPAVSTLLDDKSNLTPRGRSRGPLMDVSLSQLDRPSTPQGGSHSRSRSGIEEPPRPPPPRGEDFYSSRRQLYDDDPLQRSKQSGEPRFISFQKEGSVGIRLTGGNEAGIFVTAVQPGSPASLQGLTPGDKILKVNDMDMHGVTREEAVLFLLSLQDRIDLIVQHAKEEYDGVVANQRGDSFHIKTHFHYENPSKGEMSFKAGDVFRVIDTLHNGVVGSWQVLRISRGHQEMQRGVIPNKSRAEELATAQFNATKKEMNASESRGNFFRRRRSTHRRSKSLSRENWDDVVFSDSISKFPAYERVVLRHPGFVRPVVMFGPTADLARERLIKDFPDKFTAPLQDDGKGGSKSGGIVRLSNIRDIMDRGKHALLDITPNAVDRLNYAQFYPIVIFLKADSKHTIKQMRQGIPKSAHKSSKKLFEQCQKLDRVWSHIFSTTIPLNDVETWYRKLRESIDQQQSGAVWMSETKPVESLSDDFLFPMTTSRLSYASSPESDLELSPGPSASLSLGNLPQLVKSSSDPSIATNQDNLDRDRELNIGEGMPPPYTNPYDHATSHGRRTTIDNKYRYGPANGPNGTGAPNPTDITQPTYSTAAGARASAGGPQSIYGVAPDLPPRVDRASKPPGLNSTPTQSMSPQRNSSGGTIGRSAQEKLFGAKLNDSLDQDEYGTRGQFEKRNSAGNSIDRNQNSLDRQNQRVGVGGPAAIKANNGSYDSVSSYDSYNTTQMSVQNIRLGPNAPDDLKSVPTVNGRAPVPAGQQDPSQRNGVAMIQNTADMVPNRSALHEHARSLSNGANDLNRQNSLGRPPYPGDRNIAMAQHPSGGVPPGGVPGVGPMPQRPTNLGLNDNSPRKHVLESKTDYGKYSRNNSATQADYKTPPPTAKQIGPPAGQPPFKPVPPPKPKNYRPPIQGGGGGGGGGNGGPGNGNGGGHWENGDSASPRSPNGFFYPTTPQHHHYTSQSHNTPSSPNAGAGGGAHHGGGGNGGGPPPAMHPAYNHQYGGGAGNYGGSQMPPYPNGREPPIGNNGYNGNHAAYGGQYMHRNPGMNNMGHHPSERHALDLAGSREQRGSAFELYRKPQIGMVGHHHNMSGMDGRNMHHETPYGHHYPPGHYQMSANEMNERRQYASECMSPPPPLPPPKSSKKTKLLKSPLTAIKNAFIRSTRPLRRQASLIESDKMPRPSILKRQYSMVEQRNAIRLQEAAAAAAQSPEFYRRPYDDLYNYSMNHEPFYPNDGRSTYQNLESESIYGYASERGGPSAYYERGGDEENLYANRALIDLERRQMMTTNPRYGGRIVRRHSLAERPSTSNAGGGGVGRPPMMSRRYQESEPMMEPIYQTRSGAYMMREGGASGSASSGHHSNDFGTYPHQRRGDPALYQNRREMHRNHLYQSRSEMQERINMGRRALTDSPTYAGGVGNRNGGARESPYQSRHQIRDQVYQTRREALDSMAEPTYISKRELKHEPIYETKETNESNDSTTSKNIDLDYRPEPSGQESSVIFDSSENNKTNEGRELDDQLSKTAEKLLESDQTLTNTQSSENQSTVIENENFVAGGGVEETEGNSSEVEPEIPMSPQSIRSPYHISNVIKRTAAAPLAPADLYASRTSVETHYTSQYTSEGSLPIGPPNAQSTPFASEMSVAAGGIESAFPPPTEPNTTRGIFTSDGGTLSDSVWKVSLIIPPGAIPSGIQQEIYFTVTDPRMSEHVGGPPLDMENGETMLSPLVMCGPQGLEFLVPVTLNIPHCAASTLSLGLSLKATDSEKNLRTDWDNIELPSNTAAHTVSVKVDHF